MSATRENWIYGSNERVWVGKYQNSQNRLHWHGDCELIYAERGCIDVVCDGRQYSLDTGEAMFIAGEALHRLCARSPHALLITVIFDSGIISDFASQMRLCSPKLSRDYGIAELYRALLTELTEKPALYEHVTAAMVKSAVLGIFRGEKTEPCRPDGAKDARFKALLAQINSHFDTITLSDAASFMNMNASYLSRYFTERTGTRFMRYVNAVRVEKAAELLGGELSVTEVAERCGFGTIRNFNRMFKLLTGHAPSALPKGFVYAAGADRSATGVDPTLSGCVLVESSKTR